MISTAKPRPSRAVWLVHALTLLLAAILGATTVACARSAAGSDNLQIDLQLMTPKTVGPATVQVTLLTADGKPIEDARVSVRGDMNHAGMKPVLADAKPAGGGRYVTEDFRFTMGGDWILSAVVTLAGGEKVERTFDVTGVQRQ